MGALAATTVARAGARARWSSPTATTTGRARGGAGRRDRRSLADLDDALADADVVISSTGAPGRVVAADDVRAALAARGGRPRSTSTWPCRTTSTSRSRTSPGRERRPGRARRGPRRRGLRTPGRRGGRPRHRRGRRHLWPAPRRPSHRPSRHCARAGRARRGGAAAAGAPHARPRRRRAREVRRAVERVVDKLLHTPTVRVKELARDGQGGSYARALSELFDLDPRDVSLVQPRPRSRRRRRDRPAAGDPPLALATTQSTWVADRVRALGHDVELVEVSTEGDLDRTTPLAELGGTGCSSRPCARRWPRAGRPRRPLPSRTCPRRPTATRWRRSRSARTPRRPRRP